MRDNEMWPIILLLLVSPGGHKADAELRTQRQVVWQYLKSELDRGRSEKDYWSMRWRTKLPSSTASLFLGTPYGRYRLPVDQIERFIESGDLLQSATMLSVSFPVYDRGNLIGTVQVVDRAGDWAWYGTGIPAGSADSLAIAFQKLGSDVLLVGADKLGAYLVYTPRNGAERRLYYFYQSDRARFRSELDTNETMSYTSAMDSLKTVANEFLLKRQLRKNEH